MVIPKQKQQSDPALDRLLSDTKLAAVPKGTFANSHVVSVGVGAVGGPLAIELAKLGVRRFTLVDPKRYRPQSVESQCEPHEVGRLKVDVVAERLREFGAAVEVFAIDIFCVPDGIVGPWTVTVASTDSRRADIGANRLATRMRAPGLIKANVEPRYDTAAVRTYSPRDDATRCAECALKGAAYTERHPRSCDGGGEGRATASPRALTAGAAALASTALGQLLTGGAAAQRWLGHEWLYAAAQRLLTVSELTGNPHCRWLHTNHWKNPQRCRQPRDVISLQQLAEMSGFGRYPDRLTVTFCRQVALRATCVAAGHDVTVVQWLADLEETFGACPSCGSAMRASPFFTYEALPAVRLSSVWERPLADFSVGHHAVIQLGDRRRQQAFVLVGGLHTEETKR